MYCVVNQEKNRLDKKLSDILTNHLGLAPQSLKDYFYYASDSKVASHLFRVAAGLDSMVLGEDQILIQVKKAYTYAVEAKTADFFLHKLFHQAFRVGKRCRCETKISAGAPSMGSVAIDLVHKIFPDINGKKILLIGAGDAAHLVLSNLKDIGVSDITIINRTLSKAHKLAQVFNARILRFVDLPEAVNKADVIISSTASKQEILSFDMIKHAILKRKNRPLLIIDIAVPHDVEQLVKSLFDVFLYNIDDLQQIAKKNMIARQQEIFRAEKIIAQGLKEYEQWHTKQQVVPTIKDLQFFFEKIRQQEIGRYSKHFSEEDLKDLDTFSKSLIKKILHLPMTRLGECAVEHEFCGRCTIRKVFGLDKHE